jgi:hypothetical protein
LGVKTAVHRVIVLTLALRTHLEAAHGGLGTVIGNVLDDGEARATVSAVGKRIAVTPVARRQNLSQTELAGSDVRRDKLILALLGDAVSNLKTGVALRRMAGYRYVLQTSQGRCQSHQLIEESV